MARSLNKASGLLKSLSKSSTGLPSGERMLRPGGQDATRQSEDASPSPIQFGRPNGGSTTKSKGASGWTKLLDSTAKQSASSVLSGFSVGNLFGGGSLVSAISQLFHHTASKTPALQEFSLPSPKSTTAYVGAQGTTLYDSVATQSLNSTWSQDHSAAVAQAVRHALLNSNSLGDVIAEI